MTSNWSNEAVGGSVGPNQSLTAEPPENSRDRVAWFVRDVAEPINVRLALRPVSQSSAPSQLPSSNNDHLIGQRHDSRSAATILVVARSSSISGYSANERQTSVPNLLRGIGSQFDETQSTSEVRPATAERQ
ncbi:hypothetical protein F4806DRAFT_239010 [Annulohypoxylon nitens]|nr:hypothetical protein F4806DRAFT_239010 [Annulohypoxylon nitens]